MIDELTLRALAELVLIGAPAGALGCWVLTYRFAYASESLSHGLLPGLVIAALVGAPLLLGAAMGALVAAGAIALAARLPGVGADAGTAVAVTTLAGAGALIALSAPQPPSLDRLLFGDVLAVADADLAVAGAVALLVPAVLAGLHWSLLAAGFDRANARALGRSPQVADLVVSIALALVVVVAVRALGALLVVALVLAPAVAARAVATRMPALMGAAGAIAAGACALGLVASHQLDIAAGASVALALVAAAAPTVAMGRL